MLSKRIRYFNKYVFNRLMLRFAGSSRSRFAVVRHVGRRSGRLYETPIIVAPMGADVVVALTYGPQVDWYRNLQATRHGTLRRDGRTYAITAMEPISRAAALQQFSALQRQILRLLGIEHFVRVALGDPKASGI